MTTTTKANAKAKETTIALDNATIADLGNNREVLEAVIVTEEKNEFEAMMEAPLETAETQTTEEGIKMNADQKIKAAQTVLNNINEEQNSKHFCWASVASGAAVSGIVVGARMVTRNMIAGDVEAAGMEDCELKAYSGVEIAARMVGAMAVSAGLNAGIQKVSKAVANNPNALFTTTSLVAHGVALVDTLFGDNLVEMVSGKLAGAAELPEEAQAAVTQFIEEEA